MSKLNKYFDVDGYISGDGSGCGDGYGYVSGNGSGCGYGNGYGCSYGYGCGQSITGVRTMILLVGFIIIVAILGLCVICRELEE